MIAMIFVSSLGSLLGAFILYCFGRTLNKDKLKKIINYKVFKMFKIEEKDIEKADLWFNNQGVKAVFICRFIPIVRSLISIPAGMNKMNIVKFAIYSLLGTLIWNVVLLFAGSIVGENWRDIATVVDNYSSVVLLLLVTILIILVSCFYIQKRKKEQ